MLSGRMLFVFITARATRVEQLIMGNSLHLSAFIKRFSCVLLAFVLAVALLPVEDGFAAKKKKPGKRGYYAPPYSALVIDADSGKVLYQKNAFERRYPASLTKMMTLYLTFEALKAGKIKLDKPLSVTKRAASQPQTNISLKPGSTITVRKCIESLVVRSANDAAMVLAENIGGSEWNFAQMMTKKAQQLGMKGTVFKNPSGLPNTEQYTTAMDMAMLGIALRKNFPEYYSYFKLRTFSYNGRTYKSHNRVLDRFNGADGIKTGYINASGFNLVSSVKKDGRNIVAVVMGGRSGRSRDDDMVRLLDKTFKQFANPQYAANEDKKQPAVSEAPNVEVAGNVVDSSGDVIAARGFTPSSPERTWGIQVGAYLKLTDAKSAASKAIKLAEKELRQSIITIDGKDDGSRGIHRARLADLTEQQARLACRRLLAGNAACFVYRVG